jgi:hypothetical protein
MSVSIGAVIALILVPSCFIILCNFLVSMMDRQWWIPAETKNKRINFILNETNGNVSTAGVSETLQISNKHLMPQWVWDLLVDHKEESLKLAKNNFIKNSKPKKRAATFSDDEGYDYSQNDAEEDAFLNGNR